MLLKNIALFSLCFSVLTAQLAFACDKHEKALLSLEQSYPDEWWKPVPESDLASWEIGPQGADRTKNQVILSKRNDLGMLSNFFAASFTFEGLKFASVEGLWQSMKYPENADDPRNSSLVTWPFTRSQVEMMTAFDAKRAGDAASKNMQTLKINWVSFKGERFDYKGKDQNRHYELIFKATVQKISQNQNVKDLLMKTGDLTLMPDHQQEPNSPPAYKYYDIAMKIREAFKKGEEPKP